MPSSRYSALYTLSMPLPLLRHVRKCPDFPLPYSERFYQAQVEVILKKRRHITLL